MPRPKFLTPSTFGKLMTNGRGCLFGDTAKAVIYQLALDLLEVEQPEEEYTPAACLWGLEHEYYALREYEQRHMVRVCKADFRVSPTLDYVGGTMDGLVGTDGGVEIKCPFNSVNHLKLDEQFKAYHYQVHGYIWVYSLQWIDLCSFDPRFPAALKLRERRVERDEEIIQQLELRCAQAHAVALEIVDKIRSEAA